MEAIAACCSRSLASLQGRSQDLTQNLLNCSPLEISNLGEIEVEPSVRSLNELVEITEQLWLLSSITLGSTLGQGEPWLLAVQMFTNDGNIPLEVQLVSYATFLASRWDIPEAYPAGYQALRR
jgi:hypothetical protein